jgi:hypothetical protein
VVARDLVAFRALGQADAVVECLASRAGSSDALLVYQGEHFRAAFSNANLSLELETLSAR